MNSRRRCYFSLLIIILLFLKTPYITYADPEKGYTVKTGDFFELGRYFDEPMIWKVVNIDDNGALLLSDKVICFKAFDANGDWTNGRGDIDRSKHGSNNWEYSSLREWLNSEAPAVAYSHQSPDANHLDNGYNSYDTEPGFLTNFTDEEKSIMQITRHKSLLSAVDSDFKDGGTEPVEDMKTEVSHAAANYDNAFYKITDDKVFIPSIKELQDFVLSRGLEGRAVSTEKAIADNDNKLLKLTDRSYVSYWLRTPAVSSSFVRVMSESPNAIYLSFADNSTGVRPAVCIKKDAIPVSGNGSYTNPYSMFTADQYLQMGQQLFEEGKNQVAVLYYNRAILVNPELSDAYYKMAGVYNKLKDYKSALKNLEKAVTLNEHERGRIFADKQFEDLKVFKEFDTLTGVKILCSWDKKKTVSDTMVYDEEVLADAGKMSGLINAAVKVNNSKKTATFTKGKTTVVFTSRSKSATVNNKRVTLPTKVLIERNSFYIPVKSLSEYFGYRYEWDERSRTVTIKPK